MDLSEQRRLLKEARSLLSPLEAHGDDFLTGHYAHILQRIDAALAISEACAMDIEIG